MSQTTQISTTTIQAASSIKDLPTKVEHHPAKDSKVTTAIPTSTVPAAISTKNPHLKAEDHLALNPAATNEKASRNPNKTMAENFFTTITATLTHAYTVMMTKTMKTTVRSKLEAEVNRLAHPAENLAVEIVTEGDSSTAKGGSMVGRKESRQRMETAEEEEEEEERVVVTSRDDVLMDVRSAMEEDILNTSGRLEEADRGSGRSLEVGPGVGVVVMVGVVDTEVQRQGEVRDPLAWKWL